ncbi:ribonuclease catalytic domain-containing protein [Cellulomonas marina]|uniref:RNB domain-containing protein n=1 Tax=Cellulomonas marina TaxID=988821 RepID=A0A1I0Z2X0_9CELL|nr:RNB domain-containing ribonuclease [Cellulomonas marina]GIG28191.1 ribonuclease R [Cellulomonas marina]SFB19677.1 RNB domain-containing protein [Cellulomonas marina]
MPTSRVRLATAAGHELLAALGALRAEVGLPEPTGTAGFSAEALAQAEGAARDRLRPVPGRRARRRDRTDLPLVTIDPVGSRDLDQAVHVEPRAHGWRVHYAIADLPAFVRPGSALDEETRARGLTAYGPDGRVPLHPRVLSEGAASLLPGEDRPAVLWSIDLDVDGGLTEALVEPVLVRSRARLSYDEAQAALDAGTADDLLLALRRVGMLRQEQERARGGVSLDVPEQEVVVGDDGAWHLRFRAPLPVEGWNAQISLLTGTAAADLMLDAGVGVLRTLPPADGRDVARLRRTAAALGVPWPARAPYGEALRAVDAAQPAHLAFLHAATSLFRGAAYAAFGGDDGAAAPTGDDARHAAIAAPYAHVTAPLRRLVDRYGTEACLAACAGARPPDWVRAALPGLPALMTAAGRRASAYDRGVLDLVEAAVLAPQVGRTFRGVVVDVDDDGRRGQAVLPAPAVRAPVVADGDGDALDLGATLDLVLAEADLRARRVRLTAAGTPAQAGRLRSPGS